MGKFDKILIVSDIDGTFLGTGSKMVERNVEKIKYFTSNGGLFTFATGRAQNSIKAKLTEAFDLINAPAILVNGSFFYDYKNDRTSDDEFMNVPAMREILHYVRDNYPKVEFRIATSTGMMTDSVEGPRLSREYVNFGGFYIYPIDEIPGTDWYKCVFCGKEETLAKIRTELEQKYSHLYSFFVSEPELLEVQNKGTSKAGKMLKLKEKYHAMGRDVTVYAAGDYENDYEMLKAADVAVCPTNAMDKIKAIADISPCDNDEGLIASLIEIIENDIK